MIVNANPTLDTGELTSLLAYCMNILMSLMMLSMVFVIISMSLPSMRRISEVLNEKSSLTNSENPIMEVKSGDVEFRNVKFGYDPNKINIQNTRKKMLYLILI